MKKHYIMMTVMFIFSAGANTSPIQGAGLASCEEWTSVRVKPGGEYFDHLNWVLGFFSSYNYYHPNASEDVFSGQNYQGIATYLDGWCKGNPKKSLFDGAVKRINADIEWREMERRGNEIERLINLK
jgi:hypothetical protein